MTKKVSITLLLALCLWGVASSVALADPSAGGLVTCGKSTDASGGIQTPQQQAQSCNFAQAVAMINRLITYAIFIAMPLSAVVFAYAGWLYLSARDDTGKVGQAKKVFASVAIGFALLLSGWLIFKLIATTFLSDYYAGSTYLN